MNGTIKEQLQLAIEEAEYQEYPHSAIYKLDYDKAVDGCFEITKDLSFDFANWISENKFTKGKDYKWTSELLMYSGCAYSTAELFKLCFNE